MQARSVTRTVFARLTLLRAQHPSCLTGSCRCQQLPLFAPSNRLSFATLNDMQHEVDKINDLFVAARDELEYAEEDAETVRFDESAAAAREAVDAVLDAYRQLGAQLDEAERGKLQRSMGMKMEQLKEEMKGIEELHAS